MNGNFSEPLKIETDRFPEEILKFGPGINQIDSFYFLCLNLDVGQSDVDFSFSGVPKIDERVEFCLGKMRGDGLLINNIQIPRRRFDFFDDGFLASFRTPSILPLMNKR